MIDEASQACPDVVRVDAGTGRQIPQRGLHLDRRAAGLGELQEDSVHRPVEARPVPVPGCRGSGPPDERQGRQKGVLSPGRQGTERQALAGGGGAKLWGVLTDAINDGFDDDRGIGGCLGVPDTRLDGAGQRGGDFPGIIQPGGAVGSVPAGGCSTDPAYLGGRQLARAQPGAETVDAPIEGWRCASPRPQLRSLPPAWARAWSPLTPLRASRHRLRGL
jgi:hypothetical protein